MVYFIQNTNTGHVKIGYTNTSIKQRLSALQTGSSDKLRVLAVLENATMEDEKELHFKFSHLNTIGEWHILNYDLLDYIQKTSKNYSDSNYHIVESNGGVCLKGNIYNDGVLYGSEDLEEFEYANTLAELKEKIISVYLALFNPTIKFDELQGNKVYTNKIETALNELLNQSDES